MNRAVDTSFVTNIVTNEDKQRLKSNIERVLSEILSDKHNAKITLTFTKQENKK